MFTADLKSFADFNTTPSPSWSKKPSTLKRKRENNIKEEEVDYLLTPPITPGPATLSEATLKASATIAKGKPSDSLLVPATVADRVKRRRHSRKT